MKSLLVSLLLLAFTQTTYADLSEGASKKMYNILADWGAPKTDLPNLRTLEWVSAVQCTKRADDLNHICKLHDVFHDRDVIKTKSAAKPLYDILAKHAGNLCENGVCVTGAERIRCIHWWKNKFNPPPRLYKCRIE